MLQIEDLLVCLGELILKLGIFMLQFMVALIQDIDLLLKICGLVVQAFYLGGKIMNIAFFYLKFFSQCLDLMG